MTNNRSSSGLIVITLFLSGAVCAAPPRNMMLIGWDGAARGLVFELMEKGELPHLAALVKEGAIATLEVTAGENTSTKPTWAQILTGYPPEQLGVYSDREYGPIPEGRTIFERFRRKYGTELAIVVVAGKGPNLGQRGPHEICVNCRRENRDMWMDETTAVPLPGQKPRFVHRIGEPYLHAGKAVDYFETQIGADAALGERTLHYLDELRSRRFFMFVAFKEVDMKGHLFGVESPEYRRSLLKTDKWLGKIVARLREHGVYGSTALYVVSNHDFEPGEKKHSWAPHIFFASNDPGLKGPGDCLDIAPTLLNRYGVELSSIRPPFSGRPLN